MKHQILYNSADSEIVLYPSWCSEAEQLFADLKANVAWQTRQISLFGRSHTIPRLESFVGDPDISYVYSGQKYQTACWPDSLLSVLEHLKVAFDWRPNCALLNYYRHGQDSMGWHSDNEPELGRRPTIAILSLGSSRDLLFRRVDDHTKKMKVTMQSGGLLLMKGKVQSEWQHSLPKRANKEGRVSCTFRTIL